jgi:hypothetical protein
MTMSRCPGCGAALPGVAGPTHAYLESSPACWAAYGEVLAREYSDAACRAVHRLTVDAYSVQHPGRPARQTIQSVAVHLIGLHLVLERSVTPDAATRAIRRAVESATYAWLEPPASMGAITVVDVVAAPTPAEHAARVDAWALSAWAAWSAHHEQVRSWAAPG